MDNKLLEKLILKACLENKQYLVTVSTVFKKDYFEDAVVSEVFSILQKHLEEYHTIAPNEAIIGSLDVKMREKYQETMVEIQALEFDVIKNFDYLFNETNEFLKDKAIKGAILDSVEVINQKDQDRTKIRAIVENALIKDLRVDIGLEYFGMLQERLKRIREATDIRVPTYFPKLDEYLNGGFPPYTFSVIVSRVHGFKSNTLANVAARQVIKGKNVALLSLEMSQDAFAQRFDSIFSNLDINRIYSVFDVNVDLVRRLKVVKEIPNRGKLLIKQFPTGDASVNDFKRYLRELQMRDIIPDIIYVDYINIMKPSYADKGEMYSNVKRIAEELRALSFQFECPVVSVSQLNREGSMVSFAELDFVYISESMGVPATADFMAIYGVDEESLAYKSELHYKIVKNRLGGRVGEIDKFYYDTRSLKMYDATELDLWIAEAAISGDTREPVDIEVRETQEPRGRQQQRRRR